MNKFEPLHRFISPVTGKIASYEQLPDCNPYFSDLELEQLNSKKAIDELIEKLAVEKEALDALKEELTSEMQLIRSPKYILQQPSKQLENAQSLSELSGGILKSNSSGVISIASGGKVPLINDYVKPEDLIQEIATIEETIQAEVAALEAQIASLEVQIGLVAAEATAGIVAATAAIAVVEEEIVTLGVLIVAIEAEILALAAAVAALGVNEIVGTVGSTVKDALCGIFGGCGPDDGSDGSDGQDGQDGISETVITNLRNGLLDTILSSIQDEFASQIGTVINEGDTTIIERIENIETQGIPITNSTVKEIVAQTINDINNIIYSGFAYSSKDVDIKIKSSFFLEEGESSSSALNLFDRYDYGYSWRNINKYGRESDLCLEKKTQQGVEPLLKFDSRLDKFVFKKPVVTVPLTVPELVDRVYGTISNVAGSFAGFAANKLNHRIKLKNSYKPEIEELNNLSLDFLNRADTGYSFNMQTDYIGNAVFNFNKNNSAIYTHDSTGFTYHDLINVPYPYDPSQAANKEYVDDEISSLSIIFVTEVYGADGQILSSGGVTPAISLAVTGVTAGQYQNPILTVDEFGRTTSIESGEVTINSNVISTTQVNQSLVIKANGTGSINVENNLNIRSDNNLRIWDEENLFYVGFQIPSNTKDRIDWYLPHSAGEDGEVLATDGLDHMSWSRRVESITAGVGLTGGTITKSGTIGLADSGVSEGVYYHPAIQVGRDGRITNAQTISNIILYDNTITSYPEEYLRANAGLTFAQIDAVPIKERPTIKINVPLECDSGLIINKPSYTYKNIPSTSGMLYIDHDNELVFEQPSASGNNSNIYRIGLNLKATRIN